MPPKGSRGRGGRGRGRGASSAPTAEIDLPVANESETQSTLDGSSTRPVRTNTSPQNPRLDPQEEHSPNSSPANVPTETPAPTPARKPILKKAPSMGVLNSRGGKDVAGPPVGMVETPILPPSRASASSRPEPVRAFQTEQQDESAIGHAVPSSAPTRGRGRPSLARGTAKPVTESRFKPKNVRRDAGELEQLALKEQMRLAGIAANNAREQARWLRGRGRPARGRGDVMGRGAGSRSASGVFGVMPEGIPKGPGFYPGRSVGGGGSGSGGGPGGSSGGISGSGTSRMKQESGGVRHIYNEGGGGDYDHPQYPDLEVGDFVNIEQINTLPDSSEDDVVFTGSRPVRKNRSAGGGLKPVRLQREEHKERTTIVNTETTIKISDSDNEDNPTIDEARSAQRGAKDKTFRGVYSDPTEVTIKSEPRDDEPPSSPETKLKVKGKERVLSTTGDVDLPDLPTQEDKKERKLRKPYKKLDKKPVIQTEEDREEYERHLEDVAVLAYELGGLQGNLSATSGPSTAANRPADSGEAATDADGDTSMENPDDANKDKADERSGRLYLFQFPPVLPELYNVADGKPKSQVEIKKEEEDAAIAVKEAEAAANSLNAKGKGKAKERVDLTTSTSNPGPITAPSTAIKLEDNDRLPPKNNPHFPGKHTIHEEGWIGKLVIRKSGKVELSWGGTSLLVGRGVDASFLTAGVLVDSPAAGASGGGEGLGGSGVSNVAEGSAVGMGQIMGKFIVTPDWENMA